MKDVTVVDPHITIVPVNITNLSKYLDVLVDLYNQAIDKNNTYLTELHLNAKLLNGKPADAKHLIGEISRLNINEFQVLFIDDKPIGFISYSPVRSTVLDIVWFFVKYEYRNLGYGKQLFTRAMEYGKKNKVDYIQCTCTANDWPVRAVMSSYNGIISNVTMTVKL